MEGGIDSSHVSWLHGSELNNDPLFMGSKGNVYNEQDRMPLFDVARISRRLLIGARRNAEAGNYYWRITPWIMPWYSRLFRRAPVTLWARMRGSRSTTKLLGLEHQLPSQARTDQGGSFGDAGRRGNPRQIRPWHLYPARQQVE